jgi:3-hydroxyisobutyrate dehydrogenase
MGNRLFEVGALGCGHAMKCLNNFIAGSQLAAALEALAVGKQFGLDPTVMADVINVSSGKSFASETLLKQQVISGAYGSGFALGLLAKDVGIAADLAAQIGVDAPVGRFVSAMWNAARDELGPDIDHTKVAPYWERKALRTESK